MPSVLHASFSVILASLVAMTIMSFCSAGYHDSELGPEEFAKDVTPGIYIPVAVGPSGVNVFKLVRKEAVTTGLEVVLKNLLPASFMDRAQEVEYFTRVWNTYHERTWPLKLDQHIKVQGKDTVLLVLPNNTSWFLRNEGHLPMESADSVKIRVKHDGSAIPQTQLVEVIREAAKTDLHSVDDLKRIILERLVQIYKKE